MSKERKGEVDFSPIGSDDYKRRIEAAKQGSHTPVGGVDMPSFPRLDRAPKKPEDVDRYATLSEEEYRQAVAQGKVPQGVGGAYIANQPKEVDASTEGPSARPPGSGLREETIEQINAVARANQESEKDAEKDAEKFSEEEDDEYFTELAERTTDILNNKERRKIIEDRIADELSFDDLIMNQELRQKVPIRKGFVPVYRTPSAEEDIFVKRLVGQIRGSERYILDTYSLMNLAIGLYSLNGKILPDHLDGNGKPNENLFNKKLDLINKYPLVVVADLSANYVWFGERVQKLLSIDEVKDF